ncbi:MAG TPA: peptidylprolyl isomerase [Pyrinomonadaceae bacterium]|nr:peptidylprolyl isomerase [Pyrinomonadaceae bacterium]
MSKQQTRWPATVVLPLFCLIISGAVSLHNVKAAAQTASRAASVQIIPKEILVRIVRAEDERRWDQDLARLLTNRNSLIRSRAALAAGRIGDDRAVPLLARLLRTERNDDVRALVAFALGEIESAKGIEPLLREISPRNRPGTVNGRVVEALGKIAATLPRTEETRRRQIGEAIMGTLDRELTQKQSARDVVLLGLTAALRAAPAAAGKLIARFLSSSHPRVRADAANVLARLRLNDGNNQLRQLLGNDSDPIVRANAARVLGATQDKTAFNGLLGRALRDSDSRVRVSAIRALAALKDPRVAEPLLGRAVSINQNTPGAAASEVLEIGTTIGHILKASTNRSAVSWLRKAHHDFGASAPEIEIAFARVSPADYLAELGAESTATRKAVESILINWRTGASIAQGLGAIAELPSSTGSETSAGTESESILRAMLDYRNSDVRINTLVRVYSEYAIPDVLRALAAFKPSDLAEILRNQLKESDVIVRATAAELLGALPPDETSAQALIAALSIALGDRQLNDAALAILDSLAKQRTATTDAAIKSALDSPDYLIRRRAVVLLKEIGAGDFSERIGIVQSRNNAEDYRRAVSRVGKTVRAVITTSKGSFTIGFVPADAPLNVDNFIQLAKRGYFNGITFHRVVPNFVIQGGDPRGDGNGGPGYQIRCEINQESYERGTVGMALSGKDTGGSQWFVTHSAQPHLDGGYSVFGRIIAGMDVVDAIVRGDVIRDVSVTEGARR